MSVKAKIATRPASLAALAHSLAMTDTTLSLRGTQCRSNFESPFYEIASLMLAMTDCCWECLALFANKAFEIAASSRKAGLLAMTVKCLSLHFLQDGTHRNDPQGTAIASPARWDVAISTLTRFVCNYTLSVPMRMS